MGNGTARLRDGNGTTRLRDGMHNVTNETSISTPKGPVITPVTPVSGGEECPICLERRNDVDILVHADNIEQQDNISSHKACGVCRAAMLERNQKCPWCRSEVVWKQVLDFLDGLKKEMAGAHNPDQLADLMAKWEVYEMTRSKSDVLLFARDMVEDVAMCAHIDRAIQGNAAWLRDSSGLWARFHAMVEEGEMTLDPVHAQRLARAVGCGMSSFESNGGGAPQHGGAMYTQLCVAILCAKQSDMGTSVLAALAHRIGLTCVQFWKFQKRAVHDRLVDEYCQMVSEDVWQVSKGNTDLILQHFHR